MHRVLIANRGEVAVRIARTASLHGIATVGIYADEDARSRHRDIVDVAHALEAAGARAYLDADRILDIARQEGCDALHPGYGFLSENAGFAAACMSAGITFIGPDPEILATFGDKGAARKLAEAQDVPVAQGTRDATSLDDAYAFMVALGGPVMLKAMSGGGGRGMRVVEHIDDLPAAYERCRSEAAAAFGRADLYVEQLIQNARHIEVQILGDGTGDVRDLRERDCTLQRRHQKLIEIAPSPFLDETLRARVAQDARKLAAAVNYRGLGTMEFLVDGRTGQHIFIECNPRLQVEHTVTEEIAGLDLVAVQFALADGKRLADLDLPPDEGWQRGYAVQARVNMEAMQADAQAFPSGGLIERFEPPSGPGVRIDTFGYSGYRTVDSFDSLLAKVIVTGSHDFAALCGKAARALAEFRIEGVETNIDYLAALLTDRNLHDGRIDTAYIERNAAALHGKAAALAAERRGRRSEFGSDGAVRATQDDDALVPDGTHPLRAPMQGKIVSIEAMPEVAVHPGSVVAVLEAMKLEHAVQAGLAGYFTPAAGLAHGRVVRAGQLLGWIRSDQAASLSEALTVEVDPDHIRPDLEEVLARRAGLLDTARPEAVARRRKLGQNTARENLDLLLDAGSFVEYGGLTLAMQRGRRSEEELIRMSPADGVVTGLGTVNAPQFDRDRSRCAVMAYDYTVFAGTQGFMAHRKMDRIIQAAERLETPFILFAEGGGGRPGDTDYVGVSALEFTTFAHMARLSGKVPTIGVVAGRCFAGNAALLGCCDVIIATRGSSIGMAGPAMIEGGGLGKVAADQVGPVEVQSRNGVVDIVAKDETEAVALARRYLGYVQGKMPPGEAADQRRLRSMVPERRVEAYDIRAIIGTLCDAGSFLELRAGFGRSVVTGFARLEGQPVGIVANDSSNLGGALDSDSADKISRFLELCDAYGLPAISLCDTPGFMVGPDSEKTAAVRHFSRIFVTASHIKVPVLAVVLRKAYGLGAQAMVAGNLLAPVATVSWPTGEFGPMGIEGAVRLAYRRELEAIEDAAEREALFNCKTAELYRQGRALNVASYAEIDDVIDPAETRNWLLSMLRVLPQARPGREASGISPW